MTAPGRAAPVNAMECKVVVLGASLGGSSAIRRALGELPGSFPAPVVAVQHRSRTATASLAGAFRRDIALRVREPADKEAMAPGTLYLAPADYHLLVEEGRFALSTDAPVNHARPSIDVLFQSAADAYGPSVVAVVLTGASADGAAGAAAICAAGGSVLIQEPDEAESAVLPLAAMRSTVRHAVLPLAEIGAHLLRLCGAAEPVMVHGRR